MEQTFARTARVVLARLTRAGRYFEVSEKQTIDQSYAEIEAELSNQYSLRYSPDKANVDGAYHRIYLTTQRSDLIVQTRQGYYAQP